MIVVNMVAHLADSPMVERGVGHGASFGDAVTQRLLDEYILARFKGHHRGNGVPVVGSYDSDRVKVFHVQHTPEVADALRLITFILFDDADRTIQMIGGGSYYDRCEYGCPSG